MVAPLYYGRHNMALAPSYYHPFAAVLQVFDNDPPADVCACAYQRRPADDPALVDYKAGKANLPHLDTCARECLRREVVALASARLITAQRVFEQGSAEVTFAVRSYGAASRYSVPRSLAPADALRRAAEIEQARLKGA